MLQDRFDFGYLGALGAVAFVSLFTQVTTTSLVLAIVLYVGFSYLFSVLNKRAK